MEYLVWQNIVVKQESEIKEGVLNNNIGIGCIIRVVNASSSYEAIGKFSEQTKDIEAQQKLHPIYQSELDQVIKIG